MTATLLPFPRARRAAQLMSAEAVCRKARINARAAGCGVVESGAVGAQATAMLEAGDAHHDVLEHCAQLAKRLVEQRRSHAR